MGPQGSHGSWGPHDASGLPRGLRAHMGAGDPTMPRGSHGGSGLPQGLGAPRCLRVPTGAQGSHGGWGGPAMPRGSHRGSVLWESRGGRAPLSGSLGPPRLAGGHRPGLLLHLPRPVPSKLPAALANGARCCFGENTFWSLLSEPSQPTPTVEKM